MSLLSHIQKQKSQHRPMLAVLVDPSKPDAYEGLLPYLREVDMVFVGGSTGETIDPCVDVLREHTKSPLILFPGNVAQFSPRADALLFLSLLNARTADMLITPHVQIAQKVLSSGIESIPMGYVLIDGARKSSVEMVSQCTPIPQDDLDYIVSTAVAGQLLGKQLIYLEAGSGAKKAVSTDIIRAVHEHLTVPLIVGGGICTPQAMLDAFEAGADIVVIGNHFEQHPEDLPIFIHALSTL